LLSHHGNKSYFAKYKIIYKVTVQSRPDVYIYIYYINID
jgi:hypothetical protein